ncbi:1-acyl-sn-glycerol-3-phosphate acyltransferase [Synechococcus sp. PCC 6312]|uniref:1-acyl-sn-glycerol-3-phosphate acyltransferase n=1 Tax=Synechococcus sp. (strain ATCC 27167 / PCC 6312) TaxID=195253 RepID=UPI00029F1837|nr:1-acyl-sn-glycerol-3-phosphate acyltransferase [Synechococcus sp. PCC 6312]AFY59456.1 hypothetical protein Syn6312_0215 [Synechococcus sp. PCC 6312]
MSSSGRQAQPPLEFLPPTYNALVRWGFAQLLPLWMRWQMGLEQIEGGHLERLVQAYEQFQQGQARILLAFRHPSTDDPLCMGYLLWHLVPRQARQMGVKLKLPIHSYFLYDRGIPLWAGDGVGWLFGQLGGSSIMRGKLDTQALRAARELLVRGEFPLAAAPEGATNNQSELVSPLEPGIAQMGFWCLEDLIKAGRLEEVLIIPIGVQYSLLKPSWCKLGQVLKQLETQAGCQPPTPAHDPESLYQRLFHLATHLLSIIERFYVASYHITIPELPPCQGPNQELATRLKRLLDIVLHVAEEFFGIKPSENLVDRCRRVEQAAWERMFRQDLEQLSPVERGFANWLAQEAELRLRHMRLAERFTSITGHYVREKNSPDRFAEVLFILARTLCWIEDKPQPDSLFLGPRRVRLTVAPVIPLREYWPEYQQNRRQARQVVQTVTAKIGQSYEEIIASKNDR